MKKILLFSRDPGGANTVMPLVNKFGKKCLVKLYGKDIALMRYAQLGLKGIDIVKEIKDTSFLQIKKFLQKENPRAVITGTSADDMTEKYLWKASGELGIPSFAIIDHWVNYGIRFSKYNVSDLNEYNKFSNHDFQPSKIFVMDDYAKKEMKKIGFDEKKIIVSGQPYFELMKKFQKTFTSKKINLFKKKYNISPSDKLITFASEPLEMIYKGSGSNAYLGYTEKTVLKNLLKELRDLVLKNKLNLTLVIKPHPKESEEDLMKLIAKELNINFKIKIIKDCNLWDLIMASDLICGMSSMFLIESVILGKQVISIQIGLNKKDSFILSQRGILKSALTVEALRIKLKDSLVLNKKVQYKFKVIENASKNIISFINKFLCQN